MPNTEWLASLRPSVDKKQLYQKPFIKGNNIYASLTSWKITASSREEAGRVALLRAVRAGIHFRVDGSPLGEEDISVLSPTEVIQDRQDQIAFTTFMVWIREVGHSRNITEFRDQVEKGRILKKAGVWSDYFDEYLEALTKISKTIPPDDPTPLWSYLQSISPLQFLRKFPDHSKEIMNLFLMHNFVPGKQAEFMADPKAN
jgi:hypothetical protein